MNIDMPGITLAVGASTPIGRSNAATSWQLADWWRSEKSRNPKVPAVQLAGCPDKTFQWRRVTRG